MKKCTAFILIIALLLSSTTGYAESCLKLPTNLKEISTSAFDGASQLDVVDVPFGTESISYYAFASSGVNKIYIPSTVNFIADTAFTGTSVVISSPEFSYAQTYAQTHGLAWEDCGDHYQQDRDEILGDLMDGDISLEDMDEVGELELLSAEGVTDPEELEFINGYNEIISELKTDVYWYNYYVQEWKSGLENIQAIVSESSFSVEEDNLSFSYGGSQMTVNGSFPEGTQISDAVMSEDGRTLCLTTSAGEYYAQMGNGSIHVSSVPIAYASRSELSVNRELSEMFVGLIEDHLIWLQTTNQLLETAAEYGEKYAEKVKRGKERVYNHCAKYAKFFDKYKSSAEKAEKELEKASGKLNLWKFAKRVIPGLNIGLQIAEIRNLVTKWKKVNEIYDHGHPTEDDISSFALDTSESLKKQIQQLWIVFGIHALDAVGEIILSVAAIAGKNIGALIGSWGAFGVGVAISGLEKEKYDDIGYTDSLLHTYIYGVVTDKDNWSMTLQDVTVSVGTTWGTEVRTTNENGEYRIYLNPGSFVVRFKKDGYKEVVEEISLNIGENLSKDVQMEPDGVMVAGFVLDEDTGSVVPGVNIECKTDKEVIRAISNQWGDYRIRVPEDAEIWFHKPGYASTYLQLPLTEGANYTRQDIQLSKISSEADNEITVSGMVYEGDSWDPEALSNVLISCGDRSTYSCKDGSYAITVPANAKRITFKKDEYEDYFIDLPLSAETNYLKCDVRMEELPKYSEIIWCNGADHASFKELTDYGEFWWECHPCCPEHELVPIEQNDHHWSGIQGDYSFCWIKYIGFDEKKEHASGINHVIVPPRRIN